MKKLVLFPKKFNEIKFLSLLVLISISLVLGCKKQQEIKETASVEEEFPAPMPPYCSELPNPCSDPACAVYLNCNVTASYAGVSITYESASGRLKFTSLSNVITVLNQLKADHEAYNDNYDNLYPNYTADQLDSMDIINNFDEFKKFKDFENLFLGFVSKRNNIATIENTWLTNSFTGMDPDSTDLLFDDAENTIFNSNYAFKIGNILYEFKTNGFYINGILQDDGELRTTTICKSNKKKHGFAVYGNDRFKLKVALNTWVVNSSAKGKVVHYKLKNGNWKRSRAEMAVFAGGNIYQNQCDFNFTFSLRDPVTSFKKRKQLKITYGQAGSLWKTFSGELSSAFDTPSGMSGALLLTF